MELVSWYLLVLVDLLEILARGAFVCVPVEVFERRAPAMLATFVEGRGLFLRCPFARRKALHARLDRRIDKAPLNRRRGILHLRDEGQHSVDPVQDLNELL